MILHVKKLREDAVLPVRATEGSAGMDLHALVDAPVTLQPVSYTHLWSECWWWSCPAAWGRWC